MARYENEITHEFEGRIEYTSSKARLIEDTFTGVRYWVPKSQTIDFNPSDGDGNFMIVVTNWWYNKRQDFEVKEDGK